MLAPTDFFDLTDPVVAGFFDDCDYVWQALTNLAGHVEQLTADRQTILGEVIYSITKTSWFLCRL